MACTFFILLLFLLVWTMSSIADNANCPRTLKRNSLTSSGVILQGPQGQASLAVWGAPINTSTFFVSAISGCGGACAIDSFGRITCVGSGATVPPTGVIWQAMAMSASGTTACGIATTGTLYCWGSVSLPNIPIGLSWKYIALNDGVLCGVQTTGELLCFGDETNAAVALVISSCPTAASFAPWRGVALGSGSNPYLPVACAIDVSGRVNCWGYASFVVPPSITSRSWASISYAGEQGGTFAGFCVISALQEMACFSPSLFPSIPAGSRYAGASGNGGAIYATSLAGILSIVATSPWDPTLLPLLTQMGPWVSTSGSRVPCWPSGAVVAVDSTYSLYAVGWNRAGTVTGANGYWTPERLLDSLTCRWFSASATSIATVRVAGNMKNITVYMPAVAGTTAVITPKMRRILATARNLHSVEAS